MLPRIYISAVDLVLLDMRKVVVDKERNRATAYFFHPRIPRITAFSASLTFFKNRGVGKELETSFKLSEGVNVTVEPYVVATVKKQLTALFKPYFDSMDKGVKVW